FLEREAERRNEGPPVLKRDGRKIAAIVPVHVFGLPCQIDSIVRSAASWRLPVIEDASEALGAANGKPCGAWGLMGVLSFNYNKAITGGGGGAILTNDFNLGVAARRLVTTDRIPHAWMVEHAGVAWNFRMSTMSAALIGSQLSRLDRVLGAKRALAGIYRK